MFCWIRALKLKINLVCAAKIEKLGTRLGWCININQEQDSTNCHKWKGVWVVYKWGKAGGGQVAGKVQERGAFNS